jgi:hypothetical protein
MVLALPPLAHARRSLRPTCLLLRPPPLGVAVHRRALATAAYPGLSGRQVFSSPEDCLELSPRPERPRTKFYSVKERGFV